LALKIEGKSQEEKLAALQLENKKNQENLYKIRMKLLLTLIAPFVFILFFQASQYLRYKLINDLYTYQQQLYKYARPYMENNDDIIMEAKMVGMRSASDYLLILVDLNEIFKKMTLKY